MVFLSNNHPAHGENIVGRARITEQPDYITKNSADTITQLHVRKDGGKAPIKNPCSMNVRKKKRFQSEIA